MKTLDLEQRSEAWLQARLSLPTASNFFKVVTSKGEPSKQADAYAAFLAAEKYAGTTIDDLGTAYMDRGTELEDQAIAAYAFMTDTDPQKVGFVTDDLGRWGCSPDALVGDRGLLEIKCLKTENHVKALLRFSEKGDADPAYYQQVQGQMMITARDWCDLVFYHPLLPLVRVRHERNEDFMKNLQAQLGLLIKERDRISEAIDGFSS